MGVEAVDEPAVAVGLASPQPQASASVAREGDLTSGNNDTVMFRAALVEIRIPRRGPDRPRTRPDRLLGEKSYSSAANRRTLAAAGSP